MSTSKHIVDLRNHSQNHDYTEKPTSHEVVAAVSVEDRNQREDQDNFKKATQNDKEQVENSTHISTGISLFGWLLSVFFKFIKYILHIVKVIFLGPIRLFDLLLDKLLLLVKSILRLIVSWVVFVLVGIWQTVINFRAKPTILWGKALAIFTGFALLLTLPIKVFQPARDLTGVSAKVLGASTEVLSFFGLVASFRDYVPVALVGSEILGTERPKRLLVVFQNNRELRATGGFAGSYALIDTKGGMITNIEVPGGGFYDLKGSQTNFVEAPRPFLIFKPYWEIWNFNWFADFPTSAQKLIWFYDEHGEPTVDGVIALTPNLIEDLLLITGPIELPKYNQVIDSSNFVRETQEEVEFEYDIKLNTPKAFIADLLPIFFEKLLAKASSGQMQEVLAALDKAFEERHLMIYLTNPIVQKSVENLGWGGEIRLVNSDYLQFVHNNTGGGKTDVVISDSMKDTIELTPYGSAIHNIELTRFHAGDIDDVFEGHNNLDYIRFYVPKGSRLISAEGFTDEPEDRFKSIDRMVGQDLDLKISNESWRVDSVSGTHIFEESGKTVFGNWLGLKVGQKKTVSLSYEVPVEIIRAHRSNLNQEYTMYWQKQSGTQGAKLDVQVKLSSYNKVTKVSPQSMHMSVVDEQLVDYNNDLRVDRWLKVDYK